jgi:hypothetical protein
MLDRRWRSPWRAGYGTDQPTEPEGQISHEAKSEPFVHSFRVRVDGLKPEIAYCYTVDSMGGDGTRDGVESTVYDFTTPADLQEP